MPYVIKEIVHIFLVTQQKWKLVSHLATKFYKVREFDLCCSVRLGRAESGGVATAGFDPRAATTQTFVF